MKWTSKSDDDFEEKETDGPFGRITTRINGFYKSQESKIKKIKMRFSMGEIAIEISCDLTRS